MRYTIIVWWLITLPGWVEASPCPEFAWKHSPHLVGPELFVRAQKAMEESRFKEGRNLFRQYFRENPEGLLTEGAEYALAVMPSAEDDHDQVFLKVIDRLSAVRAKNTKSLYAPWALCRIGELYLEAGWSTEAKTTFEQFLEVYPDHSLAGGVLLGAGLSFLQDHNYLEAALVFRRLVEEPQWWKFHLEGALGLADATAQSHAWKQAYYWYQAVEADDPGLIRRSATSNYNYGLAALNIGDRQRAQSRFLMTFNLHQDQEVAGRALNHIASQLLADRRDYLALWFSQEAMVKYPNKEPGRRARAMLTRWVASYLLQDHSPEDWDVLDSRLEELDLYLSVSWDGVIESAQTLLQAPEPDLADEAQFLVGQGFLKLGDQSRAIETFTQLASSHHLEEWGEKARTLLAEILTEEIRHRYQNQVWVEVITFREENKNAFQFMSPTHSLLFMVAEAYRNLNLPSQALDWYNEILLRNPDDRLKEEIIAGIVITAYELGNVERAKEFGDIYGRNYPNGRNRGEIGVALGSIAVQEERFDQAILLFSNALSHIQDRETQFHILRARSQAYRITNQSQRAIKDYRQLIKDKAGTPRDRLALADLLFEKKKYLEAAELYQGVVNSAKVSDVQTWAKFRLGLSYRHLGEVAQGDRLLSEIGQYDPDEQTVETSIRATASAVLDEFVLSRGVRSK